MEMADRSGVEILDLDTCRRMLDSAPIGRVGFVTAGEVNIFPVTYARDGEHIVFRSEPGAKLDASIMGHAVSFEIDGWNAVTHEGFSVLVKGTADAVTDAAEIEHLDGLGLAPWIEGRTHWVRIVPTEISGRRVRQ